MNTKPGKVWLVGAGPGDPELLTVKALRVLQTADVVLHDALADERILELARPGARRIAVGKRGGCRSTPQSFIEALMVREARAGNTVVRLKGGDPFVFGRGGEERRHLLVEGIPVEIVPGITSGIAAPARVGIPVTDRDASRGVALVTGHAADGTPEPDWGALARSGLTLVIYMGVARCAAICGELLAAGMPADTPAAVIQSAWQSGERAHVSSLADLPRDVAVLGFGSPSILVIGEVAQQAHACSATLRAATDSKNIYKSNG